MMKSQVYELKSVLNFNSIENINKNRLIELVMMKKFKIKYSEIELN